MPAAFSAAQLSGQGWDRIPHRCAGQDQPGGTGQSDEIHLIGVTTMAKKTEAPATTTEILRQPAEVVYAAQLEALKQAESETPPTSWKLSPRSVLTYIIGG